MVVENLPRREPRMKLKTYIEDLLAAENLRTSTQATYASVLKNHIAPTIGQLEIEAIRPVDTRAFFADLYRRGVGLGSIDMCYRLLSKTFRAAVAEQTVGHNPMATVKRPKLTRSELSPPTQEELSAIVAAIQPRYRAMTLVMAWCGLRVGEAAGLRVEDWDPTTRRLYIRQQSARYGVGELKTDASRRVVFAPVFVAEALAKHLLQFPPVDGRLFSTRVGNWITNDSYYTVFRSACRRAKVRDFHPHELRHHAVSAMVRSGASIKAIQRQAGHATSKMTLEVYSHINDQDLEDIAARLDEQNGKPPSEPAA